MPVSWWELLRCLLLVQALSRLSISHLLLWLHLVILISVVAMRVVPAVIIRIRMVTCWWLQLGLLAFRLASRRRLLISSRWSVAATSDGACLPLGWDVFLVLLLVVEGLQIHDKASFLAVWLQASFCIPVWCRRATKHRLSMQFLRWWRGLISLQDMSIRWQQGQNCWLQGLM